MTSPAPIAARLASSLSLVAIVIGVAWVSAPETSLGTGVHWTSFAELQQPRAFANAIALPTGEILVVGGLDNDDKDVTNPKTELVDPVMRTSRVLPQTILPRLHQTMTLSGDSLVVVAGGVIWKQTHWDPVDRVDYYDVAARRWLKGPILNYARSDAAAAALKDGRVVVFGGNFDTKLLASVEIYDPARREWMMAAPMPRPRTQHTAVLLKSGRVMIVGGIDSDGGPTDTTFIYDPARNSWDYGPRLTQPRFQQATVMLANGDVLLIGGDGLAAGTSELYLASEDRFVASGPLLFPRLVATAAALPDGRVVVTGGLPPHMTTYSPLGSVEVWDPATGRWSEGATLSAGRAWGVLLRVGGALYLVSGNGANEAAFRTVERLTVE